MGRAPPTIRVLGSTIPASGVALLSLAGLKLENEGLGAQLCNKRASEYLTDGVPASWWEGGPLHEKSEVETYLAQVLLTRHGPVRLL